ncbi:PREDICTED: uncharacterized protein LOC108567751 isoform X2 [Nicrophorus vespilloides]|uniref:Uncharacterized protein LOC108567751 isoform X2 n=1 Tax=Nicrophorus vespilloides TaxID=110193 RepID=A0ABM1NAP7_NICVS|nr:PREDICTED: uncharacterized protein LOC108567751 isoform X2 [Nicrophorus vespilloides]
MGCLGDCWEIGPPPDSILFLPPPPVPAFLQNSLPDLLVSNTTCVSPQLCEAWRETVGDMVGVGGAGGDFIELPRKDVESWSVSNIDDTWLLVLVASSIGVLLLGALLAMFLLKCREMNMFGNNECSMHGSRNERQMKNHHQQHAERDRECSSVTNLNGGGGGNNKLIHPVDSVLYHGSASVHPDNRMVWAALTPRGTQHFISENYPADHLMGTGDYVETDDHYETIDNLQIQPVYAYSTYQKDYEYEDPTPLIESYQMNDMVDGGGHQLQQQQQQHLPHHHQQYSMLGNTDMRCAATFGGGGSMRRAAAGAVPIATTYRPRVSSPTRIEHPNLPPLNLYPHQGTLNKSSNAAAAAAAAAAHHHPNHHNHHNHHNSHQQQHHHHHSNSTLIGYRNGGDTLPKYAC